MEEMKLPMFWCDNCAKPWVLEDIHPDLAKCPDCGEVVELFDAHRDD